MNWLDQEEEQDWNAWLGRKPGQIAKELAAHTTRKQALGPPQKYRYEDEPVPIFGVDEIFEWALRLSIGTGW